MPPYHIVSLEDLDPSECEDSLIITFPKQKGYIRTRMPLKEVGTVKTPDGNQMAGAGPGSETLRLHGDEMFQE